MISDEEVYITIQYLCGAYPNLKFDGTGTFLTWGDGLNGINATFEECKNACKKIVKKGFKDWEINLSLVLEIIINKRKLTEDLEKTNKILEEQRNKPQADLSKWQAKRKELGI